MTFTMNRSLLLLLFPLLLSISSALCQDFPLIHYTIEDGLPSNTVYDIYRDRKGYLWISTDKGISRYNGNTFEIFTTNDGLPDNEVFFTTEDCKGRLWLSTYNGKLCYYKDGVFHTELNTPFLKLPIKTGYIKRVYDEFDSSVTIVFNDQYKFINIVDDKVKIYEVESADTRNNKNPVAPPNNFHIAYIKKTKNNRFDVSLAFNEFYTAENKKASKSALYDHDVLMENYQSQHKSYNSDGNYIYSENNQKIAKITGYNFNKYNLLRVFFDKKNKFYCTNKGIIINDSIKLLKNEKVSSCNSDNAGNYWISTLGNGIYSASYNAKLSEDVYKGTVKYSCSKNGNIYFATDFGNIYKLDKKGSTTCVFNYEQFSHKKANPKYDANYLLDSTGRYYCFYGSDHIVIDNINASFKKINCYKNESGLRIVGVFPWLSGVCVQGIRTLVYLDYSVVKPGQDFYFMWGNISNPANPVRIFSAAKSGDNIFYSAADNIYKVSRDTTLLVPQFNSPGLKYFDFFGKNLVGYNYTNQLLLFSNIDSNIKIDTLPMQNCIWNKLYKINENNLLASTNNLYRLLRIDNSQRNPKLIAFAIENSFIPQQAESICFDSDNCYFFKKGSVTSVRIKDMFEQPAPPAIYFKTLKTQRHTQVADYEATISYKEAKNISLSYTAVCFSAKKVYYQYLLAKNETGSWRDLEGTEININNPGYGTFTIKLRAKTISSNYSEPITFTLTVERPYWATWWFITLVAVLGACIVTLIVVYRIRYVVLKKQAAHNNEVKYIRAEFKSLNALMNPHFIFNTLNNVQSLFNGNEKRAANEYLRIFADLIRQNMHNISKELIPLQKEMDLVANYLILEKLRFEDQLNYTISINTDTDLSEIMVPPLLIQPLVENSIKHGILPKGGSGNILINIFEAADVIHIQIKDDGVGMNTSKSHNETTHESFGIDNIKQRIAQLSILQNKKIDFNASEEKDNDGNTLWTVVTICIPL